MRHIRHILYIRGILATAFIFTLMSSESRANTGQAFGFGSQSAGLAGQTASLSSTAFSAYQNPAAIGTHDGQRITIGWGVIWMHPEFKDISGVVIENSFTGNNTARIGTVDTDYADTFGQVIGLNVRLLPELWNISAGIVAFSPLEQLAFFDSGETYVPEYFLYRSRTERPQFELGLSAQFFKGLSVGMGVHLAYSLKGSALTYLTTSSSKTSHIRFKGTLKPKIAPYFGILLNDPSAATNVESKWNAGLVVRLPVNSPHSLSVVTQTNILDPVITPDFNFNGSSAIFYDPLSVEIGGAFKLGMFKTHLQLDYQAWKLFQEPYLVVNYSNGSLILQPTVRPSYEYRNILIPRIGEEISLGSHVLRFGYAYQPSVLKNLPTGVGNFLDPPKHIATLGYGKAFEKFMGHDIPWKLDLHLAVHHLQTQKITKTDGNEAGNASDQKIGAPGYEAGGWIWGGGFNVSVLF